MSGAIERLAGPPTAGGPEFLIVGKVRRPHGVHGDVLVEVYTDSPESLIPQKSIFLGKKHIRFIISRSRKHNDGLLLGFEGITTPEQAGRYRNQIVAITQTDSPQLPEGTYYFHELLNIKVMNETGNEIGVLTEILETGANDVYVIKDPSGEEILIPAIPDVILKIDLVSKTMIVHFLPGMVNN